MSDNEFTAEPVLTAEMVRKAMEDMLASGYPRPWPVHPLFRVVESSAVEPGTAYIFSQVPEPRPDGWNEMSVTEKLTWAAEHGCVVVIRDLA